MKKCTKCKNEKELSCFGKRSKAKDGLNYVCKECKKEQDKTYYIKANQNKKTSKSITLINKEKKKKYGDDYNIIKQLSYLNRKVKTNRGHNSHLKALDKIKHTPYHELSWDRLRIRIILDQESKCKTCEIDKWMGKPICLEINHIDGNRHNNSPSNLEALCPNCHSLTENWRGKNISNNIKKVEDDVLLNALKECKNTRLALIKVGLTPKGKNYDRCKNLLEKYITKKYN